METNLNTALADIADKFSAFERAGSDGCSRGHS